MISSSSRQKNIGFIKSSSSKQLFKKQRHNQSSQFSSFEVDYDNRNQFSPYRKSDQNQFAYKTEIDKKDNFKESIQKEIRQVQKVCKNIDQKHNFKPSKSSKNYYQIQQKVTNQNKIGKINKSKKMPEQCFAQEQIYYQIKPKYHHQYQNKQQKQQRHYKQKQKQIIYDQFEQESEDQPSEQLIEEYNKDDFKGGIKEAIKVHAEQNRTKQKVEGFYERKGGICFQLPVEQFNRPPKRTPLRAIEQPIKKKDTREDILRRRQIAKIYDKQARFKLFGFH